MSADRARTDPLRAYVRHLRECHLATDDYGEYTNCYRPLGRCTCGLDAALGAPVPSPWQAIETAPKDGTLVLLTPSRCWADDVDADCEVGYWDTDAHKWQGQGDIAEDYYGPTHWMPLPNPPSSAQEPKDMRLKVDRTAGGGVVHFQPEEPPS